MNLRKMTGLLVESGYVQGISQARILAWAAISFSRGSSQPRVEPVFHVWQADSLPQSHLRSPKSNMLQLEKKREREREWSGDG